MKKVGLITLHRTFSYGACLQSYATWNVLHDLGYNVEFIDFENPYEANQKNIISRRKEFGRIKNLMETAKNLVFMRIIHQRRAFREFHSILLVSDRHYSDVKEMQD